MISSIALAAALSSTGLISLAPNLILLLFPSIGTTDPKGNLFLVTGQALAAGGLLGDVFLHILSHAHSYENEHVGLWILLGFTIFLVADMILRTVHNHSHDHHSHSHDNTKEKKKDPSTSSIQQNGESTTTSSSTMELLLTPAVMLNIAGDALHNFTDGLAIGASFATYTVTHGENVTLASIMASQGGLATISILFHEIPHELGDYCVLVRGGFSKKQAITTQFCTAIAAMIGSLVGLLVVEGWGSHSMVYLTAGGFVYLACVTILPQVLEESSSLKMRILQLLAFGTGIAFMYAVLMLEEHDHDHSHGHYHSSSIEEGAAHEQHQHHEHASAHHHNHEL